MDGKDYIFSQNWIEQFRRERRRIRVAASVRDAAYWVADSDIFAENPGASACALIDAAFPWDESAEGDDVWSLRYHDAYGLVR